MDLNTRAISDYFNFPYLLFCSYFLQINCSWYGVTTELTEWFEDFLRNREQIVVSGKVPSNWAKVLIGVFLVYINDLPEVSTNTIKLYPDDSKLLPIVNDWSYASRLQGDLDSVSDWMSEWRIK